MLSRGSTRNYSSPYDHHHGSSEITVTDFVQTVNVSLPPFTFEGICFGITVLGDANVFSLKENQKSEFITHGSVAH